MTVLLLSCCLFALEQSSVSTGIDPRELAEYRLELAAFDRFREASQRIATVIAGDASLRTPPLFSREIVQGGDVAEASAVLETRLREHPGLAHALKAARISPREYTKFALTLVAARFALGFLDTGVLKSVPPGPATDNVAFVRAHTTAVDQLLEQLRIEAWRPPAGSSGGTSRLCH